MSLTHPSLYLSREGSNHYRDVEARGGPKVTLPVTEGSNGQTPATEQVVYYFTAKS